ncbi:RNA polymerase sigma factor (sigma-70 family) [Actinocorallia herbida]|uniref:RNA polymerase sigma factor (Sigma-70 family) n=1 Tax=Actinocorallia herbida TaxID=58109 RepID=A0A3N1D0A8_9ACTN|nr:sigma-70 family RNA polymerase sigma factor [Actinocorallia herbida]ROO86959.1 RNA polymerase sigma factor (sigma-70 family) [Actinocorallia herbida]
MRSSGIDVVVEPGADVAGGATAVRAGPEDAADFESVRHLLFRVAYRTLGRAADAEDVVQDVWVCRQGADRAQVRDRLAFLVTITTRTALNAATSARARREVGAGAWSPERWLTSVDPEREAERGEVLELAVRLLLERLSPVERAVYVLREAFGYPFREIAELLGLSEANARQPAVRARRRLAVRRHRPGGPAERARLLAAFRDAAGSGDLAPLLRLLRRGLHAVPGPPVVAPGH